MQRQLQRCHSVSDVARLAARKVPRALLDYVEGGADNEQTIADNRTAFTRRHFAPRALRDVSQVATATEVLGQRWAMPVGLGPTGYSGMMHPDAEFAVCRAAASAGIPYVLSTLSTRSIEAVAQLDHDLLWFQLYFWHDPELALDLVERAARCDYAGLMVTIDTPVAGHRPRDLRNGFGLPPALSLRAAAGIAARPAYALRMLRGEPIRYANAGDRGAIKMETLADQFNSTLTWETLERLRERWPRRILIKGSIGPQDAAHARDLGFDGVVLSNHGGRQLDRCAVPLDQVSAVRNAVGPDFAVLLDSGIRDGADVVTALALGADATLIGRAYLYGLMAAGERGVAHVVSLLNDGLVRTMQLMGLGDIDAVHDLGHDAFWPGGDQPAPTSLSG